MLCRIACFLCFWVGVWGTLWGADPAAAQELRRVEGREILFEEGRAYDVTGGRRRFLAALYDPGHLPRSYRRIDGILYRLTEESARHPVRRHIATAFEGVEFDRAVGLADLVGPDRSWTSVNLQSPKAPRVADFVALRRAILTGEGEFLDNRIDVVVPEPGRPSLLFSTAPPSPAQPVSKAALENELIHAGAGDRLGVSMRVFLQEGQPVSLLDLESSYIAEGPGPRVMMDETGRPWIELKWLGKPSWWAGEEVRIARAQWVDLRVEYLLDARDGRVRLWLDGELVIDGRGPTLALEDAVIDRLQVGITAAVSGPVRLLVEDVRFDHW